MNMSDPPAEEKEIKRRECEIWMKKPMLALL